MKLNAKCMSFKSFLDSSAPFVLAFFLSLLLLPVTSFAQEQAGVGIRPLLIEKGADPGQVLNESISIINQGGGQQTYYLFTRDIKGVNANGSPIFMDPGTEITGFELSSWLQLGEKTVTLNPGEEFTTPLTITVPDDATPGSHFGGVFVSVEPPDSRQLGATVGYEVANIISIRISGDVNESAMIRSLSTDKLVYGETKVKFNAQIRNSGNVLVRPVGPLEITNMFGSKVASFPFNENQNGVFPGTGRSFDVLWEDESIGFGRYEARLSLVYGEAGRLTTISKTASFWILPMNIIGPAIGILAFLLLITYLGVRFYIKSKLATVTGGSRRLARQRRRATGTSPLLLVLVVMLMVTALFLILLLFLFA